MKRRFSILLIAILLMTTILSSFSLAISDKALEVALEIFVQLDEDTKEFGVSLLRSYLRGDRGIDDLKNDLPILLSSDQVKKLESLGYSLDDVRSELDRLKSWSQSERDQLISYIEEEDTAGIKKLVKSAGKSTSPGAGGGSPGPVGGGDLPAEGNNELEKEEPLEVLFTDIKGHKHEEAIYYLAQRGIIKGKNEKIYDPDGKLTRAEYMALIDRVLELKPTEEALPFEDVSPDSWYYEYIKAAYDNKIINGTSKTSFEPDNKVTREQMVAIVMRILRSKDIIYHLERLNRDIMMYEDAEEVSNWAAGDMFDAVKYGIIEGRTDSKLCPRENATRGEAADIIKILYDLTKEQNNKGEE